MGDEILHQATDKTLRGITGAENVLAWILRFIVPLLMFHVMFAFLLAIILNPYTILRVEAARSNTVWRVRDGVTHYQTHASPRACEHQLFCLNLRLCS